LDDRRIFQLNIVVVKTVRSQVTVARIKSISESKNEKNNGNY